MANHKQYQPRRVNSEVKIIPYLMQWLFKDGLPPGWGK